MPIVVAHRGVHQVFVENSLEAFSEASRIGIPWIECDVWLSADGVPVVIHDETLERTSSGLGLVRQQPWALLEELRLRRPDGSIDEESRLPTLLDVCRAVPDSRLLVEIKPADTPQAVRAVLETLQRERGHNGWMIQSFDSANLVHATALDPGVPFAFLVDDRRALDYGLAQSWANIHLRHDLLDRSLAADLHARGIRIGVWTPNSILDLQRVIDAGADLIITDEPALLRQVTSDE